MQVKEKQIVLTVATTKRVADIVISISIPFKGVSIHCLKKLTCNCPDDTGLAKGSEEASLAFALFEAVRDKLSGSGLELFKTKASNVSCASISDSLVITFHTQGTGTSLRKTCGILLSCLNPIKLFAKYSENMKFLSGKSGNREEFNFFVKKLADGIKKEISIVAVGKINTDAAKLKDIIKVLVTKLPTIELPSAKETETPGKKADEEKETYPIVKCDGLSAAIIADYIRNNSNGMSVGIIDEGVVIYNKSWESKHKQLKDSKRIKDYINKKYAKLEDKEELSAIFAYFSLSEGFINSNIAEKIIASKLKTDKLIELLKKAL